MGRYEFCKLSSFGKTSAATLLALGARAQAAAGTAILIILATTALNAAHLECLWNSNLLGFGLFLATVGDETKLKIISAKLVASNHRCCYEAYTTQSVRVFSQSKLKYLLGKSQNERVQQN